MLGFLKKAVGGIATGGKKMEKKDQVEACIAACMYAAHSEGGANDAELQQIAGIIESNPTFALFQSEVGQMIEKYNAIYKGSGNLLGNQKMLKEIRECGGSADEKLEICLTVITVIAADGSIGDKEVKAAKTIARELGVNIDSILAEAIEDSKKS